MHDQFEWPEPEHEADEIILRNVRNHGCHVTGIQDATPTFAFSTGLYLNYGHPELIIFGQSAQNAQAIINLIRDRAAAGHQFVDGDISDELLENGYKLGFLQVPLLAVFHHPYLRDQFQFDKKAKRPSPGQDLLDQSHFGFRAE